MHCAIVSESRRTQPLPTAVIIDSQSVPGADTVGRSSRGYDAGRRSTAVDGASRWTPVAAVGGGDGGRDPRPRCGAAAAGGVADPVLEDRVGVGRRRLRRTNRRVGEKHCAVDCSGRQAHGNAAGFAVLPRRFVVERTFAWNSKDRRCVRDYETRPDHHEAMVHIAMIVTMSRRLARAARHPSGSQTRSQKGPGTAGGPARRVRGRERASQSSETNTFLWCRNSSRPALPPSRP